MEGHCSTGQSPQWAAVPMEEEEEDSNTKFHENPSSGSRVVPWRRTDMTKLIVPSRNFANGPKNDTRSRRNEKGGIVRYVEINHPTICRLRRG